MEAQSDIQVLKANSQNCTQVNSQRTTDKPRSEWLVKTQKSSIVTNKAQSESIDIVKETPPKTILFAFMSNDFLPEL